MRKPLRLWAIAGAALVGLGAGQAQAAPTLRVQVDQKGDFALIGNTLGYDCANGTPNPVVGTVGPCGTSTGDSAPDLFWRSDSPLPGGAEANALIAANQARSTAVLNLPAGAVITHAYLYWGAYVGNNTGGDNQVTIARPGTFTQDITADAVVTANNSNAYQARADITGLVQQNGVGAYRVSGITMANIVNVNNDNIFGGWWMAVFYTLPGAPPRNLALFDGLDLVANGQNQSATISGFTVPNAGFDGKLGVITYEGDNAITGDQLFFGGGAALSDGVNPATNFFNGTRSTLGTATSVMGDLPQLTGGAQSMGGMDLDIVDITAKLTAGQTSAPIQATTSGDVYYLAGWVTSISTFKPDFTTSEKTAVDLNGGALLAGDTLQYTIVVTNTGNDASINTVLTDPLPAGITYVPGSLSIVNGPNAGAKTDMTGDDQGEYTAGNNTLTVRLGVGADAANGGVLAIGETTTITFQATVDAGAMGTISNQAIINAGGQLGAPPDDTPTDGNGGASGQPPTDVVIDLCEDNSQCGAPTPICDVGSSPKICVQCLTDDQCPGSAPTCNPGTNECECIPSGVEICNFKDDDCNGMVDEGFNVGMTCTVGVGACQAIATTSCNNNGEAFCPAEAGQPTPEVCGDNIDNDCNGSTDEGCLDSDGDGIPDDIEILIGTNPNDADSDDDGVPDGQEPDLDVDTDGDGLINALDPDSDNDGLFDGTEMGFGCGGAGTNQGAGNCIPDGDGGATTTDPLDADTDDGGVSDGAEDINLNGVVDAGETDPNEGSDDNEGIDSDGDGLSDGVELQIGTDPNDADSDDDGVPDGKEPNPSADTDGDGIINALDPDSDNDGLFDGTEMGFDCDDPATDTDKGNCVPDGDNGATTTSPLDPDTDHGGVSDGSEDTNLNGVIDAGETDPNDPSDDGTNIDSDGDGLSDGLEATLGTDPNDADSDDDGVPDGLEPNPGVDSDGDGKINALDPDSDDDGIFDGTEMGFDCGNPGTDINKGTCIPDGDGGATTTSPLDADTDDGGVSDGEEDANHNGVVDSGEKDPNDPTDDFQDPGTGGGGAGGTGGGTGGSVGGGGAGGVGGGQGGDDGGLTPSGSGLFCATHAGSQDTPGDGVLVALGAALALAFARRRRRNDAA
ncbi:MAG: isopeptide-forming domain-containing fimbrial protein [Polyangiaceae bacterium]